MPIEIKELVVKANVVDNQCSKTSKSQSQPRGASGFENGGLNGNPHSMVVQDCAEQLFAMIKSQKER